MSKSFWEMLAHHARSGELEKLSPPLQKKLRSLSEELEAAAQQTNSRIPGEPRPGITDEIQPEILEWARQQLNEEETVAGLREIRETGGLELEDFLHELEQEAAPHE
jgi:hypothetical protein